jgi:hypothetical protein
MKNPRVTAVISLIGIAVMGGSMLFSQEASSAAVATLQWIFLAGGVIGLIGSLVQMANGR